MRARRIISTALFPFLIGLAGLRQTIIFAEFRGIGKGSTVLRTWLIPRAGAPWFGRAFTIGRVQDGPGFQAAPALPCNPDWRRRMRLCRLDSPRTWREWAVPSCRPRWQGVGSQKYGDKGLVARREHGKQGRIVEPLRCGSLRAEEIASGADRP